MQVTICITIWNLSNLKTSFCGGGEGQTAEGGEVRLVGEWRGTDREGLLLIR